MSFRRICRRVNSAKYGFISVCITVVVKLFVLFKNVVVAFGTFIWVGFIGPDPFCGFTVVVSGVDIVELDVVFELVNLIIFDSVVVEVVVVVTSVDKTVDVEEVVDSVALDTV